MKHLQIFYPDADCVLQVKRYFAALKHTTFNIYNDDDMGRIDIDTEEKMSINYHDTHITIFIGPAILLLKYNQFECISIR